MHDDRSLGLDRPISRRDFLDGVALGLSGAVALPGLLGGGQDAPPYYPPSLTGLRGAHVGAYEAFHALRDGKLAAGLPMPAPTGERYDLVVVKRWKTDEWRRWPVAWKKRSLSTSLQSANQMMMTN